MIRAEQRYGNGDGLFTETEQIREAHLNRDAAWFSTYRNLAEINAKLDQLAAASGGLATTFVVGNTLEGRQVRGIRFTGPDRPGNPRNTRPAATGPICTERRASTVPPRSIASTASR